MKKKTISVNVILVAVALIIFLSIIFYFVLNQDSDESLKSKLQNTVLTNDYTFTYHSSGISTNLGTSRTDAEGEVTNGQLIKAAVSYNADPQVGDNIHENYSCSSLEECNNLPKKFYFQDDIIEDIGGWIEQPEIGVFVKSDNCYSNSNNSLWEISVCFNENNELISYNNIFLGGKSRIRWSIIEIK